MVIFFFFKQKTAYEMRISDWSSDVCSSDLSPQPALWEGHPEHFREQSVEHADGGDGHGQETGPARRRPRFVAGGEGGRDEAGNAGEENAADRAQYRTADAPQPEGHAPQPKAGLHFDQHLDPAPAHPATRSPPSRATACP